MKNLHVSALLDIYGNFLSEKQKNLAEYYYNEDLSLSEIAENEGITRQAVNDLIKRAEAQLLIFEEKCRYCEYFTRLKELADNIGETDDKNIKAILDIINDI